MRKKLRVIVTDYCGKACDGCCNKDFTPTREVTFKELCSPAYREIMFTGGDPAQFPKELVCLTFHVRQARGRGISGGRIYSYMSSYPQNGYPLMAALDQAGLDGIHYTLHAEATDNDVIQLKEASDALYCGFGNLKSKRLAIDSRLYDRYDFRNIRLKRWDVIRKMMWLDKCPLPEGEELVTFDMLKWYTDGQFAINTPVGGWSHG